MFSLYFRTESSIPVSVTGPGCDLGCLQCLDRRLDLLPAVRSSEDLLMETRRRLSHGVCLMEIDGGCDMNGNVPVSYVSGGMRAAHEEGMSFSVRLGLPDADEISLMRSCGADFFIVYMHQDPDILRMMGAGTVPEDYQRFMDNVSSQGGRILPHVSAGYGRADLLMSLDLLEANGIRDAILDTVVPVPGSCLEESSLTAEAVSECASMMAERGFDVCLGHCRDMSLDGLETACAEAGVRRFQSPSEGFVRHLDSEGLPYLRSESCLPF